MSTESYRRLLLRQQTELRRFMLAKNLHEQAIQLFLSQHAMLHSAGMAHTEPWSFEDEIFRDLEQAQARHLPPGSEHTITWLIWHMARCEDIAMNLLVAGSSQVLLGDDWLARLNVSVYDTGNGMDQAELAAFSEAVDLAELRAYRLAVGQRTRQIVLPLGPEDLKRKVDPARLQRVWDEGALVEAARGIAEYWSKRDVAGLLLMPATRHSLTHLNEALQVKHKCR